MNAVRHRWDLAPSEAIALQNALRGKIVAEDRLGPVAHVAGVDVGFEDGGKIARAAVAVLSFPALALVDCAIARLPVRFPYIPGLLSFREAPAVLAALKALRIRPDLVLVDGQGMAHPRRLGIASHLGLAADIPSIGVAKSRLIGAHREPAQRRGASAALKDKKETIGAVLRTQAGVNPVYVSVGHRVSLKTALGYVLKCATKYRLPETTRWAHRLASSPAREAEGIRRKLRAATAALTDR
ncbi:MAG: deoxyribonuclease V [Betaproteobacteria bacterium]|nr:deoxyribonuclease V [Betaproteobacteria bacterium]